MGINCRPAEKMGISEKEQLLGKVTVQADPLVSFPFKGILLENRGGIFWKGWCFKMGYWGLKQGTENANVNDRNQQGRSRAESLQGSEKGGLLAIRKKNKAWAEEDHLRTLQDVRNLLARGPPMVPAEATGSEKGENTKDEWQEREGGLRQRETLQQFSNWICEEKASKSLGGGRGERCKEFGTFVGGSFRGSNGNEMCKRIYDRERERCKVTHGIAVIDITALPRRNATNRPTVRRT